MSAADQMDKLTRTFSADKRFCSYLFQSDVADSAGRSMAFHRLAVQCIPPCYRTLLDAISMKFEEKHQKNGELWTSILIWNIQEDIRLASYLSVRGLISEAGVFLPQSTGAVGLSEPLVLSSRKDRLVR